MLESHTLIRNDTVRLLESPQASDLMATARFSVSNMASLLAMPREGLGVTILPRLVLPEDALGEPHVEREIDILTPRRHSRSPAAKAMRETFVSRSPLQADAAPRTGRD